MFRIKVHDDFEVILIIKGVFWNMPTHPNFICSLKYQGLLRSYQTRITFFWGGVKVEIGIKNHPNYKIHAIEELAIAMNINLIQLKSIRKIFQ